MHARKAVQNLFQESSSSNKFIKVKELLSNPQRIKYSKQRENNAFNKLIKLVMQNLFADSVTSWEVWYRLISDSL